jgi:hypothetical protein
MREDGLPIPEPVSHVEYVEIPAESRRRKTRLQSEILEQNQLPSDPASADPRPKSSGARLMHGVGVHSKLTTVECRPDEERTRHHRARSSFRAIAGNARAPSSSDGWGKWERLSR